MSSSKTGKDTGDTVEGGDNTSRAPRKFFPRLKSLLSEEYEEFLREIIEILEQTQVAEYPMATSDTPWLEAFEALYGGPASEYALPHGKNRLHKFKEKMVELWSAMNGEITLGIKSEQHPIYHMATKQWRTHQMVMKDKGKLPHPVQLAGAIAQTARDSLVGECEDIEDSSRPKKKTRTINSGKSGSEKESSSPDSECQDVGEGNTLAMPKDLIEAWKASLYRLESMMTASGLLQPKLPSPLYELHRLKMQMKTSEFDNEVRSTYEKEIGRYLRHCSEQCRIASQPGFLPQMLEGVDMLRQTAQPATLRKSLDYCHKLVLAKYLRLVDRDNTENHKPQTGLADASFSLGVANNHSPSALGGSEGENEETIGEGEEPGTF